MDRVRGLVSAVDALCAADPPTLADGESLVALQRELERMQAVVTRATAAFDAGGSWAADGARSSAAWLATRCGLPLATARRRVRLGRDLRHMPVVEAAWLTGDIGEAQVAQLAEAITDVTRESFARDEEMLVGEAEDLPYRLFTRALAYWSQHADPDGVEDAAAARYQARRLHLSCGFDGAWFLDGVLDPISGEVVSRALNAIEDEFFAADWAEAKARVGEGACSADVARSPAQRRADALVEMAPPVHGRATRSPPARAFVHGVGRLRDLLGTDVRAVQRHSCARWSAGWTRPGPSGWSSTAPIGSRTWAYPFTGATRRSVEVRDRECFHPLCDAAIEDCQLDHVEPWSVGGLTVDENGRLACAFHNRLRHQPRPPPPP